MCRSSHLLAPGLTEEFSEKYKKVAEELNVKLAPDCPLNEKAFTNQVRGKVLGVFFDTTDCTWRLGEKKLEKTRSAISLALQNARTNIREWQKLCGRLNDICQMCSFMKIFRHAILKVWWHAATLFVYFMFFLHYMAAKC